MVRGVPGARRAGGSGARRAAIVGPGAARRRGRVIVCLGLGYSALTAATSSARPAFASANSMPVLGFV
jgi:hypothetical protein